MLLFGDLPEKEYFILAIDLQVPMKSRLESQEAYGIAASQIWDTILSSFILIYDILYLILLLYRFQTVLPIIHFRIWVEAFVTI